MSIVRSVTAQAEVIDDVTPVAVGQWYWYDKSKDTLGWAGEPEGDGPEDEAEAFLAKVRGDGALDVEFWGNDDDEDEDENAEAADEAEAAGGVEEKETKPPKPPILCCVTGLGSNYVELTEAAQKYSSAFRVALGGFDDCCVLEPDPQGYIRRQVAVRQDNVRELMDEIRRVTAALGVTAPGGVLSDGGASATTALAAAHSVGDITEHKALLIRTKEEVLPNLFKRVEAEHATMALWMQAELLPMHAQLTGMKTVTKAIESRIFTVELYAGLVEEVTLVRDGAPAPNDTKVALFQRRHYMDEECLANYAAGGMNYTGIGAFDAWLARPENAGRVLPLPRCIVAFRVRRREKDYSSEIDNWRDFISFAVSGVRDADMWTFLYLRNGDRIYRLQTKIDFGEHLFPDKEHSILLGDPNEPLWFDPQHPNHVITQSRYAAMLVEAAQARVDHAAELAAWKVEHPIHRARDRRNDKLYEEYSELPWDERETFVARLEAMPPEEQDAVGFYGTNPIDSCYRRLANPKSPYSSFVAPRYEGPNVDIWARLTPSHVYYDDAMKKIREETDAHNQIAAVIQGILDRSPVFHPHPPWRIFTPEGFAAGIDLVYDDDERVLVNGAPPEFEEYRRRINANLSVNSVCVGQDQFWAEQEAIKYNERRADGKNHYDRKLYRPYGNPGPGLFARPARVTKTYAVFKWMRAAQRRERDWSRWGVRYKKRPPIEVSLKVPLDRLFNVSAYTPGDYKMFFADPRTRAAYLQWAPFLLRGEDFAAGKVKVRGEEAPKTDDVEAETETETEMETDVDEEPEADAPGGGDDDDLDVDADE